MAIADVKARLRRTLSATRGRAHDLAQEADAGDNAASASGFWASAFECLVDTFARIDGDAGEPVISGYRAVRSEPDVMPALHAFAARGWRIALPRVEGADRPLTFHAWNPGDAFVRGAFGIEEPSPASPRLTPHVVLVPLLGFDARGYRLGYGGGFYDRTLAGLRQRGRVVAIGIAYDAQEVDAVPIDRYDQRLDHVLTPSGLRSFQEP
ncbi:MAG: 5-formyltetrahydrofolate cyclo-ligase [Pseudomonadota bacterium]